VTPSLARARHTTPAARTRPVGRSALTTVPVTPIRAPVPVTGGERRAAITFLATTTNSTVTAATTTTRTSGWTLAVEPGWYSSRPPRTRAITPNTDRKACPASLRSSTNRPTPSTISASPPSCTGNAWNISSATIRESAPATPPTPIPGWTIS
jgi:hypothetical protein